MPHANVTAPPRALTRLHMKFEWTKECQAAFNELKRRISDKTVLVPYVPHLDARLYVDHGRAAIALTIAQHHTNNKNLG